MTPRLFALTLLSLLAFAGNSLLCRIALKQTPIDPTSFVAIRLLSGALILWLVLYLQRQSRNLEGSWFGALALLAYAMTFAYAYSQIPAGTGALLLFASIQISMILYGLIIGERLSFLQSIGVAFAVSGLVMLMLPSVGARPVLWLPDDRLGHRLERLLGGGPGLSQSGLGHRRQLHPRHADRPGAVLPAVPGIARGPGPPA